MTIEEQHNLIKYGASTNILVTPVVIDGELGVSYLGNETREALKAHHDLLNLTCELAA